MSLGIYIHIPFCVSKCKYCDFNSGVASKEVRMQYINALCYEIKTADIPHNIVDTIYFGGGTPTILEPEQLIQILDTVKNKFRLSETCEITAECNPATMGKTGFKKLISGGFNRLSTGMQSADEDQLKILGRIHTFEDCKRCVSDAREAGFKNLSLDLMFGLPNQNKQSFLYSLKNAVDLNPDHISCYSLKIEEGTPFAKMTLNVADDEESRDMYDECVDFLKLCGYGRYEVSNFAKDGFESRHNIKYWKCSDFAGFGAGAYSCINGERYSNIADIKKYIERIKDENSVVAERIAANKDDLMSEFVFLGLRMDNGIDADEFKERFSVDITEVFGDVIDKNLKRRTMIKSGSRLTLAPDFVYVSNTILSDFV